MSATSFPSQTPLDAAPRKSRVGRIILFVVLGIVALLLVLGGVAYAVAGRFFGAQHNTLALLPADTQLYASINPSLSAIPGLAKLQSAYQQSDPDATADAERQLEDTLGINFRSDVQPWIGAEMAIAASGIQQLDADADAEELAQTADVSILLASRDDAKAEAALAKIRAKRQADHGETFTDETYKGVQITSSSGGEDASPLAAYAIVEHNAVIASRADTIKQMIDRVGATENTLAQSDAYKQTIAGLPANAVAYAYISGDLIRDAVELSYDQTLDQMGDNPALRKQIEQQRQVMNAFVGGGASISAPADGVQFDASIKFDMAQLNQLDQDMRDTINAAKTPISDALLRSISKDAILTYAGPIPDTFRTQIEQLITSSPEAEQQVAALEQQFDLNLEQDVLGWLSGEFALVALPAGEQSDESMAADIPASGYLVVRSKDMAAAKTGLPKIATALEQIGGVAFESKQIGGAEWQVISDPGTEQALGGYGFVGDAVVLGFLEPGLTGAAGASSAALPDDATFKAAQGRVASPSGGLLYLDVPAAVDVALNVQDQTRADFEQTEAGKALKPIESVIAGGEPGLNDEGLFKARLFVTINEQ